MTLLTQFAESIQRATPGGLPPRVRVLYVTSYHRTGGWLAEAFAADSATEVILEEAVGATAGITRLRDDVFDAVMISHDPGDLDALDLVEGLRVGGTDEPLIILGSQSEQELAPLGFEVGADAYVCVNATTTRTLIWIVARAIERHQLIRENRRLSQGEQNRLRLEHEEAERLLGQQRALIQDLESIHNGSSSQRHWVQWESESSSRADSVENRDCTDSDRFVDSTQLAPLPFPPRLVDHYREMLRAYVIMGSGNLASEMNILAELLVTANISARQTMQLHVQVLEELILGLGNRSARHVLSRADLLVVEVMVHLGDNYRRRYLERKNPPRQLVLPGFEEPSPEWFGL